MAFASNEAQFPATEPASAAIPPQAGGSVAVDALLKDARALVVWMADHNKDVLAAASRVEQAQAGLRQGRLFPNPALSGTVSDLTVGPTNPPGLTRGDTAIYGTVLSETVEIGKRGPRIESAELRVQSERNSYLDTLNDRTAEARFALGRIAYLGTRQSVLEESLAAARQNLDIQRSRVDNGDLSGNDFDRLQVDTMLLESEVSANRQEYEGATVSCGAVLRLRASRAARTSRRSRPPRRCHPVRASPRRSSGGPISGPCCSTGTRRARTPSWRGGDASPIRT